MKTLHGIILRPSRQRQRSKGVSRSGKACASRCKRIARRAKEVRSELGAGFYSPPLFRELIFENRAIMHYEAHMLEFADVFERVNGNGHDVRKSSRRQDADLTFHVEHFRGAGCRRLNGV